MVKYDKLLKENSGYILIIAFLLLYVLTKFVLFAILCAISMVALFLLESLRGVKERGWKKELEELLIAVLVGVAVWYGGGFLLNTSAPLDAVVSCSMLPHLQRGDMVVLRGEGIKVPEVEVTASEWEQIKDRMRTNFTCGPCSGDKGYTPYNFSICRISWGGSCLIAVNGKTVNLNDSDPLFSYNYGVCTVKKGNEEITNDLCVKAVMIKGVRFEENFKNDIVVYEPERNSIFAGSIIHRVLAGVSVEGRKYYIIKGDNNEIADVQVPIYRYQEGGNLGIFFANSTMENKPVPQERIKGNVVFRAPYLGYLKLFLWGYVEDPAGCDTTIG